MRKKVARGTTVAWYGTVGNIVNLRTVQVGYDAAAGRALLDLGTDMTYVLSQSTNISVRCRNTDARYVSVSKAEARGSGSATSPMLKSKTSQRRSRPLSNNTNSTV